MHSDSIFIPDQFFIDYKKSVRLVDEAMSEHFKPDRAGRAWFRNPDLSEAKIAKRTKAFSSMLACVYIKDQRWVDLVQSHYANLIDDGGDTPVVTEGMMRDYFLNIEGMRTIAFDLVSKYRSSYYRSNQMLQMTPSFKFARIKKGDAFRKQKARSCVKEVICYFTCKLYEVGNSYLGE